MKTLASQKGRGFNVCDVYSWGAYAYMNFLAVDKCSRIWRLNSAFIKKKLQKFLSVRYTSLHV